MDITRYGGGGASELPFARAVGADGWLFVSGQVPSENGQLVTGNITVQAHAAIRNLVAVLNEAGYGVEHVVRCGVWLQDARDFGAFNAVFREYFGAHPPARATVNCQMVVDCKIEIECVAYKRA